jgi:hypothetical protein
LASMRRRAESIDADLVHVGGPEAGADDDPSRHRR